MASPIITIFASALVTAAAPPKFPAKGATPISMKNEKQRHPYRKPLSRP